MRRLYYYLLPPCLVDIILLCPSALGNAYIVRIIPASAKRLYIVNSFPVLINSPYIVRPVTTPTYLAILRQRQLLHSFCCHDTLFCAWHL